MKQIAVLLTVFNRKQTTLDCLRSLFSLVCPSGYDIKVYLTDDGCTDGTPEALKAEFPQVNIISGNGSLYWNRGMIAAWNEAAKSDPVFYLWLNDDTILLPDALKSLIATAEKNPDTIVVGTCHATDNPDRITYGARDKSMSLINPHSATTTTCKTFNGNIVLVPDCVYRQLGTLDPIYRHSLGDFDYGLRASKAGIGITVAPGIQGICDTHATIAKWCDPDKSFAERWRHFLSPTGANPFEFFRFRQRHYGLIPASLTFCTNLFHVLFPSLWKK